MNREMHIIRLSLTYLLEAGAFLILYSVHILYRIIARVEGYERVLERALSVYSVESFPPCDGYGTPVERPATMRPLLN